MSSEPASIESLRVLYQSDDYIVVDKHWDIRIDSKMWYEKQTVQMQLQHHFPHLADPSTYYGFRFCHQLDFSTSGALCVALNKAAAGKAYRCFKDRTVTKAYLSLHDTATKPHVLPGRSVGEFLFQLRGWVENETQTLDFAIGKNSMEGKTHMMCIEGAEGCENPKPSQTELIVLEYGVYDGDPVTKVLLQPLTGRTHQLRVHCSEIGHPIVGDFTYSLGADDSPYRMMLHAYLLQIPLEPQQLLVTAGDPFIPAVDPKWVPQRSLRTLEATVEAVLEHSKTKEKERVVRRSEGGKRKQTKQRRTGEESEEQRRVCQEWLSEWAGD